MIIGLPHGNWGPIKDLGDFERWGCLKRVSGSDLDHFVILYLLPMTLA
jgi:hypothetical protein